MRTLALDLSQYVGWAAGTEIKVLDYGTRRLPSTGENIGEYLCAYRNWLLNFHRVRDFGRIIFESPILSDKTTIETKRKLFGLANVTEMICHDEGIECREAYQQNWRMHFIGVTRAPKHITEPSDRRKWIKRAVIEKCNSFGWKPEDDNAADALGILDYCRAIKDPLHAVAATPLFRDAS